MLKYLLFIILTAPIISILISLITRHPRVSEFVNLIASIITLLAVLPVPFLSMQGPTYFFHHYFILDAIGAWVMLCVGIVYFLASIYTIGYMRMQHVEKRLFYYYTLFALFAFIMFIAPMMNNIAVYWIGIEMSTIVSTFLVSFVQAPKSVEAAWKYIIIVSAGIALALLGIIFFYWGGTFILGPTYHLTWPVLQKIANQMNPSLLLLAFLLVLVGFGTKVGLAPMHTWLPDAHSEGPAPVSAMLSGALLNVAMLGIVRFVTILDHTAIAPYVKTMMVLFGALSLAIAALFIVKQKDIKRLMAYSSVEHMGVLALGFGFGGPIGFAGALYHMLNHSLNKSLMFFGAGNAMHVYNTKEINGMNRVFKTLPFMGGIWLAGAIAITGSPPFGLFLSEITVLRAGMSSINEWAVFVMAVLLIIIFCGFLNHFRKMYFSDVTPTEITPHEKISKWCITPMIFALIPLFILGVWWPAGIWHFFMNIYNGLMNH